MDCTCFVFVQTYLLFNINALNCNNVCPLFSLKDKMYLVLCTHLMHKNNKYVP